MKRSFVWGAAALVAIVAVVAPTAFLPTREWNSAEPKVTVPAEVRGSVNDLIVVTANTDCENLEWFSCESALRVFPPQMLRDSKSAIVCGPAGRYRLFVYGAKGSRPTKRAECVVSIGDVPPGPTPPGPGPTPPTPPTPPAPPAPIPADGFRVLVIYESAELSKLPPAQLAAFYSASVRQYLNSHCVIGRDGKTREWRMWDQDVDASNESQVWQDALKRKPSRDKLPWVIVSNGKSGYEGPMPANPDAFLDLLKKYAEGK